MSGTNIGDELNAAGLSLGLLPGRLPAHDHVRAGPPAAAGSRPATLSPTSSRARASTSPCRNATNQAASATRTTPVGAGPRGTGQYGYKDDYIPHQEPFQYYASTANPHHLTVPTGADGHGHARRPPGDRSRHAVLRRTAVPQFNTPNHQYDMSDFDQLVAAIGRGRAAPLGAAGGQLPEGPRLRGPGMPPTRIPPTSSSSSRARSTRSSALPTGLTPR